MSKAKELTKLVIDRFKDNEDEFAMLKGILCLSHGWDFESSDKLKELVDTKMIAERMDEVNNKLLATLNEETT